MANVSLSIFNWSLPGAESWFGPWFWLWFRARWAGEREPKIWLQAMYSQLQSANVACSGVCCVCAVCVGCACLFAGPVVGPVKFNFAIQMAYFSIIYNANSPRASGRALNIALNAHNVRRVFALRFSAHRPPAHLSLCHLLPWLANANLGICNFLCLFIYASICIRSVLPCCQKWVANSLAVKIFYGICKD